MIKEILTTKTDREFLEKPCIVIETSGVLFDLLIKNLFDTANCHAQTCAGLAANQIGYHYRVFVMKYGTEFICIVNPQIVSASEKRTLSTEGCLSRPGCAVKVMRHRQIKARYFDPAKGHEVTKSFKGFDAIVFQHEFDHCNGKII